MTAAEKAAWHDAKAKECAAQGRHDLASQHTNKAWAIRKKEIK